MKSYFKSLIILMLATSVVACKSKESSTIKQEVTEATKKETSRDNARSKTVRLENLDQTGSIANTNAQVTAPVIIFKPKKEEYANHIMISLDNTKTKVTSYPSRYDAKAQMPEKLEYGFYLDKRGVKANTVVLKYTIQQWGTMEQTPSQEVMLQNILDEEPFEEIYYCGRRSDFGDNLEQGINKQLGSVEGKAEEIFKKAQ